MKTLNDSAKQNLTMEINKNETNATHEFDQACNDLGDYYDCLGNDKNEMIEQPLKELIGSSIDTFASNEQFQATAANAPFDNRLNHSRTETVTTQVLSHEQNTPDVDYPVFIQNPICNIFRIYMDTDFTDGNINPEIPKLKDCSDNPTLWFGPASIFANARVEGTLVFKDPYEHFYIAPFGFVRKGNENLEIENPTIFNLKKDAVLNNDCFSLNIVIAKLNNNILKSDDKQTNKMCQIKEFLSGNVLKIDHDLFSSLEKDNSGRKKKMNKSAQHVTPTKLAKLLKIYTPYLLLRRTHWNPVEKRFVPEPKILFCSNPFTPVNASVKSATYGYSPNKLVITQLRLLPVSSLQYANQYLLQVSYVIPRMYECTQLKNKYLKVVILTASEQESFIHPMYKILNEQRIVDSELIHVDQHVSTVTFNIVKRTMDECETDAMRSQGLPVSSSNSTSVRTITTDDRSMISFRVQLQLCDNSNDEFVVYPRSTVVSDLVIDEPTFSERHVSLPSPVNDNLTDNTTDHLSVHTKRLNEKETNIRTGSPPLKCVKHT